MPPARHSNTLHELFSFRLSNVGSIIAFATSPGGIRLVAATDQGSIVFYDTRVGHHQVHMNILPRNGRTGMDKSDDESSGTETKLVWISEFQLIFSGDAGHLYYINLTHGSMNEPPIVHVSYGFQYHAGRITFLAYDVPTCTLVVAYEYFVTIWCSFPEGRAFELVDRIEPKRLGLSALISPFTVQFIRHTSLDIFIAGAFGYIHWSGPGQASTQWVGPSLRAIGTSAILPRTGDLVVTTFDHEILRWPVRPSGSISSDMAVPIVVGHHRFDDLRPDTAPAITPDEVILIARENHIVMVCPGGRILQEVQLSDGHTPRGIQTHGDRVYLGIDGLDGDVVFMALTTKKDSQRKLEQLRRTKNSIPQSPTRTSQLEINLSEISTLVLERINPRTNQTVETCKHRHPSYPSNRFIMATFLVGIYNASAIIRIVFTLVPGTSNAVGSIVLLAHNDVENAVTQWLAADSAFMNKLAVQMTQWVRNLD